MFVARRKIGNREQGTGNREQGIDNKEQLVRVKSLFNQRQLLRV